MQSYSAPWCKALKVMSVVSVVLLGGILYFVTRTIPAALHGGLDRRIAGLLLFVILGGAALFTVTGYELDARGLRVRRLLWFTLVPLDGLERVWHDPKAMKGSLRLFGNGGMFSITGLYQNKTLGRYRAFVTDPSRAVVLVRGRRTAVVSPADPEAFLQDLKLFFPGVRVGAGETA